MEPGEVITVEEVKYLFDYALGFPPREADVALMVAIGLTLGNLTDYLWDHWMGEPDEPSVESVEKELGEVLEKFRQSETT